MDGAVDERGASYMAEAKGGVQGTPAAERERETDPAHLGYAGVALGVMTAISRDERRTMILNVRNRGTIAGLPDDAVVEVPTMVDANGVHPLTLETQPDLHQLGLMQQVKAVERHISPRRHRINGGGTQGVRIAPPRRLGQRRARVARRLRRRQSRPRQGVVEALSGGVTAPLDAGDECQPRACRRDLVASVSPPSS